jgi:hypothetical protein
MGGIHTSDTDPTGVETTDTPGVESGSTPVFYSRARTTSADRVASSDPFGDADSVRRDDN